jgi:hypothetical protein
MRVPVYSTDAGGNLRCIDIADEARARRLTQAHNAQVIRRRKDRRIVEIHLTSQGDDSEWQPEHPRGNPRRYSHDHESEDNPRGTWKLKHIPDEAAEIFTAVLDQCLMTEKKAA